MNKRLENRLIGIDAVVNIILGLLLLLFPTGLLKLLGLPSAAHHFYTSLLGAVILGIGIALLLEMLGKSRGLRGLGIGGAIAINFCGGGVLLFWLIFKPFDLPIRGQLVLWSVCIIVLGVGIVEIYHQFSKQR